jgi:hypothetical protein
MTPSSLTRVIAATAFVAVGLVASGRSTSPRFFADDPIWVDPDSSFDAGGARPINLSEGYDFLENTFGERGSREAIRALNVNTLDEVPDSSWFTNRIGRRPMTAVDIARGPDRVERLEVAEWVVVGSKGPAGFQPGFRAVDSRRPEQWYQLEVDPRTHAELATGAEIIGTAVYHAIGYNVVDTYLVDVDPRTVTIGKNATIRDASGVRPFTRTDLDTVFRNAARNHDGTYRMTASRFVEGVPLGNFKHFGTRPDDPNDVYPHEHRRELRGNRVFAAWLNHDDSRANNTLDMLVTENGRKFIRHYMFDFGSILGSTPEDPASGREYMYEGGSTVAGLFSLGLWVQPWQFINYRRDLPAVGRIQGDDFDPAKWKPAYPNAAFINMRADDAFWAARIVARFSDDAIAAIVAKARYSDPRTIDYMTGTLIKRRDKVVAHWLTAVNPAVDFAVSAGGELTFANAAEQAGVAAGGSRYRLQWSRFDNATGTATPVGDEVTVAEPNAQVPERLMAARPDYLQVRIAAIHQDFPAWEAPVTVHFRRAATGWTTVGVSRLE